MRQRPRRGVRGAKKNSIRNGAQAEKKIRVTRLEGRANQAEARAKTRSGKGNHRNSQMDKISKGTRWSRASVMASNAQVGGDAQGPAAMWSCPTWPGCWDCRRGRLTAGERCRSGTRTTYRVHQSRPKAPFRTVLACLRSDSSVRVACLECCLSWKEAELEMVTRGCPSGVV